MAAITSYAKDAKTNTEYSNFLESTKADGAHKADIVVATSQRSKDV